MRRPDPAYEALDGAARRIELDPRFRVLRDLASSPIARERPVGAPALAGLCLDCETTGLDHACDAIIELAMTPFVADADHRIVEVGRPRRWLEDPGVPIPPEITCLVGLSGDDVRGRAIGEGEAACLILSADVVIAHNASFDRPFVERRLPTACGRPWVCSMRDVDWRAAGYEGASLPHLLMQSGVFYHAHRADVDVAALLRLLDVTLPSGLTVLAEAVRNASRPRAMVRAVGAPFETRSKLKARRYRWSPLGRCWSIEVDRVLLDAELSWLDRHVYAGSGGPRVTPVGWEERHLS